MPAIFKSPTETGLGNRNHHYSVREEAALVYRRRWTSFLTWAFVLAEMAGRGGLLPTSAHAGDETLGRADHASGATAPIANNLPNVGVSTATEAPEPITYQHAPTLPAYAPTPLSSELGEAKIAPIADGFAHGGSAAGGGDFGGQLMSTGDASLTSAGSDGAFVAFNASGEPIDLGLSLDMNNAAQGLQGGISDVLSSLPVDGGFACGCAGIRATEAQCDPVVGVPAGIRHERRGIGRCAEAEVDVAGRADTCPLRIVMPAVQADE